MKTFPLMISKNFMHDHPKKGTPTYFRQKIMLNFKEADLEWSTKDGQKFVTDMTAWKNSIAWEEGWKPKLHTIRTNYEYWARIAKEVNAGRGVLSLRQWTGSPYNRKRDGSKQEEFLQLPKMGIQEFKLTKELGMIHIDNKVISIEEHSTIAQNDGLSQQDFYDWFKLGRKETTGAIIHFTDFRY